MSLEGKHIGFVLTGSFCTFELAFAQMQRLAELGAEVMPIASYNAVNTDSRFGKGDEFIRKAEEICGAPVVDSIPKAEPIGPQKLLDAVLIAPCTGNTLAKLANAVTDTPALMAAKAHMRNGGPLVLAIASNDALAGNAKNIGMLLNAKNVYFVPFGQDGPGIKDNSLQSKFSLVPEAIEAALEGKQLQPLLLGAMQCLDD